MPGRFVNAIFGQLDCVPGISAAADSRADRTKPLPRSFLTSRNRFPLAEPNGGQLRDRAGHRESGTHRRLACSNPESPGQTLGGHEAAASNRMNCIRSP
jgi:hypothetical protein